MCVCVCVSVCLRQKAFLLVLGVDNQYLWCVCLSLFPPVKAVEHLQLPEEERVPDPRSVQSNNHIVYVCVYLCECVCEVRGGRGGEWSSLFNPAHGQY